MKLENKIILIISPDNWGYLSLSKHNYAKELSKKNTVYFLEPFSESKEVVINQYRINVLNNYIRVKGLSKLPRFLSRKLMKIEVNSILKQIDGGKVDVIWSFDTSRLHFLDLFKSKLSIAHIVDLSEDFNFKSLVETADVCLAVADSIKEKVYNYNSKVFKIDHGYRSNRENNEVHFVSKYEKLTGIYIGNLNMRYIDWESLFLLTVTHPNINFNFFGPLLEETINKNSFLQKMTSVNNVFFKGYLNPDMVEEELRKSSFCLVSYLHKEYGRQLDNSHKIMQYLGSGTPVFSSFTYEYRNKDLLYMYDSKVDVLNKFDEFLKEGNLYLSDEHKQKRIGFALSNSYNKQLVKIEECINSIFTFN